MKLTSNPSSIFALLSLLISTIFAFPIVNAQTFSFPPGIISVAWSPDGSKIVGGGTDGLLQIWDANTEEVLQTLVGHTDNIFQVAWSPDSKRIVSGGEDLIVRVWDAKTGQLLAELPGHTTLVLRVEWSPDGTKFASLGWGGSPNLKTWDADTNALLSEGAVGDVYDISWKPDSSRLAIANSGSGIYGLDVNHNFELRDHHDDRIGQKMPTSSVSWNSDGSQIAAGGFNNLPLSTDAYILDVTTGDQLAVLPGHIGEITVAAWSPDDTQLVTVSQDQNLRIWDTATGEFITTISLNYPFARDVAWSPDGSKIAYGGPDGTINIVTVEEIVAPTAVPLP